MSKPRISEWMSRNVGPPINMGGPSTSSLVCPECGRAKDERQGFVKSAVGHKRTCEHGKRWRAYRKATEA